MSGSTKRDRGPARHTRVAFAKPKQPPTLAHRVFNVGKVETSPDAVRTAVMRGVAASKMKLVNTAYGFTRAEMANVLGVAPRTLNRHEKSNKRLSASESDALARLVRVFDRAVEVLGSDVRASAWLKESNVALGGNTPMEWLTTDVGASEVLRVLGRLEHGVFG